MYGKEHELVWDGTFKKYCLNWESANLFLKLTSASVLPPYDDVSIDNIASRIDVNDVHSIVFLVVDEPARALGLSRRIESFGSVRAYKNAAQQLLQFLYNQHRKSPKKFGLFHSKVIA